MKKLFALICLAILGIALHTHVTPTAMAGGPGCTGDANCHACTNCKYCRHCAKEGGTCGVKDRLLAVNTLPTATPLQVQPPAAPVPVSTTAPAPPFTAATPPAAPKLGPTVPPELQDGPAPMPVEQLSTCITAIASQSDPAKLATLGSRQANPRLKRIMYWLAAARDTGADPSEVIDKAQAANGSAGTPRAALVKASLLRNLKICDGLGMLDPENRALLRRGNAPVVRRGPYTGQKAEVDHIVPLAQAGEIGNELANLEMLPATLNRAKSDKVGERQLALAKKFREAGLIDDATMANIQARFVSVGTGKYELREP